MWDELIYPFPNFNDVMDRLFRPTRYWAYDYLSMLGLKLISDSKIGPWYLRVWSCSYTTCCFYTTSAYSSLINRVHICVSKPCLSSFAQLMFSAKPLSEPMPTYCQFDATIQRFSLMTLCQKIRLQNGGNFAPTPLRQCAEIPLISGCTTYTHAEAGVLNFRFPWL